MRRLLPLFLLLAACGKPAPAPEPPKVGFADLDLTTLPKDLPSAIAAIRESMPWDPRTKALKPGAAADAPSTEALQLEMNRDLLKQSFDLGCDFLVRWQLPEGNFRYMYDWLDGTWIEDDHQVRQAGSLWGIGTCVRERPTPEALAALDKGFRFWFDATVPGPEEGTLALKYRDEQRIDSGSVALVALALVERLKTDAPLDEAWKAELEAKLKGYLAFLQYLQKPNGHIAKYYDHAKGRPSSSYSPYYDGESLLAMCKAARQLGMTDLVPTIEKAARGMIQTYTVDAWKKDKDSADTKGFYQWGSMSFVEYSAAGWKDASLMEDATLALGWWMTHTHATLKKRRNHAYAMEGLISAWRIAHKRGDRAAEIDLLYTIDRSMKKLGAWQIGGPLASENPWMSSRVKPEDEMAKGGVMNAEKASGAPAKKDVSHQLRIDVTQHQMHAITMALEDVYPK